MNSDLRLNHLTDDQLDDALIGDLAADHAGHLAVCEDCCLRLAEAGAPLASFNAVSLAWSERRSATLPVPAPSGTSAWMPRAVWGATAVAVFAVGLSLPSLRHGSIHGDTAVQQREAAPTLMASTGVAENPAAARDEQIASDNRMLEGIDRELDVAAPSLEQEYGLHIGPAAASVHD